MSREFWASHGLAHLTPAGQGNPEGWDVWSFLASLAGGESVVEIGCGAGRLCRAFNPARYLGVDINPAAIEAARAAYPGYRFEAAAGQCGDVALLYTVLLHVADDELPGMIDSIDARRVIVAEIMGRHWRRAGNPPVYNREAEEYEAVFARCGYALTERHDKPYRHYRDTQGSFLVFDRQTR